MYFKYYPSLSIVENLSSLLSGKNRFNGCALLRPVATLTDYKLANSLYRHKKNVETPPPLLKKEKKKLQRPVLSQKSFSRYLLQRFSFNNKLAAANFKSFFSPFFCQSRLFLYLFNASLYQYFFYNFFVFCSVYLSFFPILLQFCCISLFVYCIFQSHVQCFFSNSFIFFFCWFSSFLQNQFFSPFLQIIYVCVFTISSTSLSIFPLKFHCKSLLLYLFSFFLFCFFIVLTVSVFVSCSLNF